MSDPAFPDSAASPWPLTRGIDQVCDQFEAAWQTGESNAPSTERPRIEDFLGQVSEPERLALLHELILLDVAYCRLAGETPQPEEYQRRFAALEPAWLARALDTSARATVPEPPTPTPR